VGFAAPDGILELDSGVLEGVAEDVEAELGGEG
jgi:hypothetical protein